MADATPKVKGVPRGPRSNGGPSGRPPRRASGNRKRGRRQTGGGGNGQRAVRVVAPAAASSAGGNIDGVKAKVILVNASATMVATAFTGDPDNAPDMSRFVRGGSRLAARRASVSGGTDRSKSPGRGGARPARTARGGGDNQEIMREAVADVKAHPAEFNAGVDAALAACETAITPSVRASTVLALAGTYSPKFLETAGPERFRAAWADKNPKNHRFLRAITDDRHKVLNPPFPALRNNRTPTRVEKWLSSVTSEEIGAAGIIQHAVSEATEMKRMIPEVMAAVAASLYQANLVAKYGEGKSPTHLAQAAKAHAAVVTRGSEIDIKAAFAAWRAHIGAAWEHVKADPNTVWNVHYPFRAAEAGASSSAPAGL